jgi:hypothetical protein
MTKNIIKVERFSKGLDGWIRLEDGRERKIYWKGFINSGDWVVNLNGKKYIVISDMKSMTATIDLSEEYV